MEIATPEEIGLSTERLARIDQFIEERYLATEKIAGAQLLVARHGQIGHLATLGRMAFEGPEAMREDAIFRIYSMTKPITTVAAMMLYEKGLFQLNDPVHAYIPEFRNLRVYEQGTHPDYLTSRPQRPMRIKDLLMHTSGLTYGFVRRSNVDHGYRKMGLGAAHGAHDLAGFVAALAELPLEFSPGTAWNYGVSTDVLGYLVEVVSGRPFAEFLQEEIFAPLDMKDTGFFVPPGKAERLPGCYELQADGSTRLTDAVPTTPYMVPPKFTSGGGGLVSTTADYFRFSEMLRQGGALGSVRLLSPRTIDLMTINHLPEDQDLTQFAAGGSFSETPYEGVGFGLGFSIHLGSARTSNNGSFGEFAWGGMASTAFWIDPAEELVVVFMTQLIPSGAYNFRAELRSQIYAALMD